MKKNNSHSALQLWITLASIPVLAVIAVYVYGAIAFDDNTILEIDPAATHLESERIESEDNRSDLDREFTAPLDKPTQSVMTGSRPSMLPELSSTRKEESLTQMLSKKNENLRLGSNGHPVVVRVQEEDNLMTLAERHLGNEVFWPYVYMVNKDKLPKPESIKAGMTLCLPDSAYYDININDSLAIQKAEAMGKKLLK